MAQFLQDLPSFSNPTVASVGCYQNASTTQRLKFPDGFPKTSESRVLKAAHRKVLRNSDLSVNFRAFEEAQSLGVLYNNASQMDRLKKTEAAELLAAFKNVPRTDDMLPERKVAVTVVLHNCPKGNFDLLDAAAFLARTPDQRGRRAAQDVRFFFLAGDAATAFVSSHRTAPDASAEIKSVMGKRGEPIAEVCVSWVDRFDAETGWARTQNSFCEVEYQTDSPSSDDKSSSSAADKYVNAIRKAINKAADRGGCKAQLGRVMGFYPDTGHYSVNGTYERACIETSDDFFEVLHGTPVCKLSEYCRLDDDFNGELEHTNLWVRLIPNFPKESSPTSEACTSGMLLHQKGFEEQAKEFCASIQIEERKKDPNRTIYGLRLPKQDEVSIAPHVLFVSARAVTMHAQVTAYSLAQNVVGKSLYRFHGTGPQERWGTMVYSLQRQLVPLDASLLGRMFVCPCREESCAFPQRDEYAVLSANFFATIYNAKEQCFKNVFDSGFKLKKKVRPEHGSDDDSSDDDGGGSGEQTTECKHARKKRRIVPTEEERVLLKALHFDLLYPALSLGDAHAEMTRIHGPEEFSQFLLAIANQTSLETSLLDGCTTTTEILRNFAEYKKATDMKLHELQTQLENVASDRSTSSSSLDTLATAPADAPVEEKLTLNGLELLRKMLGLAYTVALQLPQQMDETAAAALLKKVSLALGVKVKEALGAEQRNDLTGQLVRLGEYPFLRSIAAVASATLQHAKETDGIVVACAGSDGLSLYVCKADGQATPMTPVSLLNTDVSRLAFVLFNEAQRTVTTLRKRE